jgi:Cys-tRNA(Pro)/Cys-tRNA(Cys) deacylase
MPRSPAVGGPPKTNVTRLLESRGIAHRVVAYEVDPADLSAVAAAEKLGLDPGRVFKTLALVGDRRGVFLCCVPAASEVDLKKAARASLEKSARMLPLGELLGATGYQRGGCSPLGTRRAYDVFIDESARLLEEISVSAGARGTQVILAPGDLLRALDGRAGYADLT